jgi:hypothetical protein
MKHACRAPNVGRPPSGKPASPTPLETAEKCHGDTGTILEGIDNW